MKKITTLFLLLLLSVAALSQPAGKTIMEETHKLPPYSSDDNVRGSFKGTGNFRFTFADMLKYFRDSIATSGGGIDTSFKNSTRDSVVYKKGSERWAIKDSVGSGGGIGDTTIAITWADAQAFTGSGTAINNTWYRITDPPVPISSFFLTKGIDDGSGFITLNPNGIGYSFTGDGFCSATFSNDFTSLVKFHDDRSDVELSTDNFFYTSGNCIDAYGTTYQASTTNLMSTNVVNGDGTCLILATTANNSTIDFGGFNSDTVLNCILVHTTITFTGNGQIHKNEIWVNNVLINGTVTSVTAIAPLFSSGGTTPNITTHFASTSDSGAVHATDFSKFNNKIDSVKRALGNDTVKVYRNGAVLFSYTDSIGSGSDSLIRPRTVAQAQYMATNSLFTPGQLYEITDLTGGSVALAGSYIILSAFSTSSLYLTGNGIFENGAMSGFVSAEMDYDLTNDVIHRVKASPDGVLPVNELTDYGAGSISVFPFDNVNAYGNTLINNYIDNFSIALFKNNYFANLTEFEADNSSTIQGCICSAEAYFQCGPSSACTMTRVTMGAACYVALIDNHTFRDCIIGDELGIDLYSIAA